MQKVVVRGVLGCTVPNVKVGWLRQERIDAVAVLRQNRGDCGNQKQEEKTFDDDDKHKSAFMLTVVRD